MTPNCVESRQLEEGCDSDCSKVLLQFPKQRGDRRFCFMYSIDGGRAAERSTYEIRKACQSGPVLLLTGWGEPASRDPEGQPCFRTTERGLRLC